jgi:membrane dipeptidase
MFIVDAHLDLAMNAVEWNRDLRKSVTDIRQLENGMHDLPDRGNGTVSLPALRQGNIGLVVATQIARVETPGSGIKGWATPEQAWAQTQKQLQWYLAMETAGEMVQIKNNQDLEAHLTLWKNTSPNDKKPIGYILSLEGADSIVNLDFLHQAHAYGLRAIGPAHYGPGRYAHGTNASSKLNEQGKALLKEMEALGMILDATHLCDDAFWEAMELFQGTIWASHHNCRSIVNHNRQLSDAMIKILIQKNAVIGGALDAWMMVPNWERGVSIPNNMQCNLEKMIDHMDHICQIAGNTNHVGIGTDLDGAFGKEQCPYDLDTIADLQFIPAMLIKRGYTTIDCEKIMHGNWLRLIKTAWKSK